MLRGIDVENIKGTFKERMLARENERQETLEHFRFMILLDALIISANTNRTDKDIADFRKQLQTYNEVMYPETSHERNQAAEISKETWSKIMSKGIPLHKLKRGKDSVKNFDHIDLSTAK